MCLSNEKYAFLTKFSKNNLKAFARNERKPFFILLEIDIVYDDGRIERSFMETEGFHAREGL